MRNPATYKAWMDKRIAEGICVDCSREALDGYIRCAHCLELNNEASARYYRKNRTAQNKLMRKLRARYIKENRCPRCGGFNDKEIDQGFTYCVCCRGRV